MATVLGIYQEALRILADVRLATVSDVAESRLLLDDSYADARDYVQTQAWWQFAMTTTSVTTTTTPAAGYAYAATVPSTWLAVHSAGTVLNGTFIPLDYRIDGTVLSFNTTPLSVRAVARHSTEAGWPPLFAMTLAAFLAFQVGKRITGDGNALGQIWQVYQGRLNEARSQICAEDPLRYMDGDCARAARHLLETGFWNFSMRRATLTTTTGSSPTYAFAFTPPADLARLYDVCVVRGTQFFPIDYDWNPTAARIYTKFAAAAVRYSSTAAATDFANWPQQFVQAYLAFLKHQTAVRNGASVEAIGQLLATWQGLVADGLSKAGQPEPVRLHDGEIEECVLATLEEGMWKFAMVTATLSSDLGTPSIGFTYKFAKPATWARTIRVFRVRSSAGLIPEEEDVPFLDEGGNIHTNLTPVYMRYVSDTAKDPIAWTELFSQTVYALLDFRAATSAAERERSEAAWRRALKEALTKDALNQRPKTYRTGSWLASRRYSSNREQGL